jgi:hypothetical protein
MILVYTDNIHNNALLEYMLAQLLDASVQSMLGHTLVRLARLAAGSSFGTSLYRCFCAALGGVAIIRGGGGFWFTAFVFKMLPCHADLCTMTWP